MWDSPVYYWPVIRARSETGTDRCFHAVVHGDHCIDRDLQTYSCQITGNYTKQRLMELSKHVTTSMKRWIVTMANTNNHKASTYDYIEAAFILRVPDSPYQYNIATRVQQGTGDHWHMRLILTLHCPAITCISYPGVYDKLTLIMTFTFSNNSYIRLLTTSPHLQMDIAWKCYVMLIWLVSQIMYFILAYDIVTVTNSCSTTFIHTLITSICSWDMSMVSIYMYTDSIYLVGPNGYIMVQYIGNV